MVPISEHHSSEQGIHESLFLSPILCLPTEQ